ncbi:MAG: restriction endonuclease subunit S [Plesiomonas shigelloides]
MANEWVEVKLSDLGEVARGRSRHRPRYAEHLYGGNYPFIQTGDVKASNGRISTHQQTYSEAGLAQSRLWPKNTMCITIAANIAETGILQYPACFPDSVIGFIADESKADVYFIEYLFRKLRKDIQRQASGSVQDNINLQTIERLKFNVPPVHEQRRIAIFLNVFEDKITLNRQINQTLEQMAQTLFKSWFVDFDPVIDNALDAGFFEQHSDLSEALLRRAEQRKIVREQPDFKPLPAETRQLFPAEFEECEEPSLGLGGWVPKGWRVSKVSDACENIFSGGTPDTRKPEFWDGALCWLSSGETRNRLVVATEKRITELGVEYSSTKKSIKGDILIASAGQGYTRGQTSLNLIDTYINQSIVCLRPLNQTISSWLFENIYSRYEEMRALSDSHSIRGSLTTKLVANMPIILPCEGVLALYSVQHKEQICVANACLNNIEVLSNLRDTLLPKLISGELRLNDDGTLASGNTDC